MSLFSKRPGMSGMSAGGSSFLPEDYLRRKNERRSILISLALFAIVVMGIIGAFFVSYRQWNTVKQRQEQINREYAVETQKIEELKQLEAQKTEMLEKAEVTTALIEKVPRSILLAELINRMPKQLTLSELNLKSKRINDTPRPTNAKPRSIAGPRTAAAAKAKKEAEQPVKPKPVAPRFEFKLEIVGLSASDEDVADYVASLVQCPLLQKVEMLYSGTVTIEDVEMRKFRVEAQIRPTADARKIEPLHVPRLPNIPGFSSPSKPYDADEMDPTRPRTDKSARTSVEDKE